jgi:hypothetical protein
MKAKALREAADLDEGGQSQSLSIHQTKEPDGSDCRPHGKWQSIGPGGLEHEEGAVPRRRTADIGRKRVIQEPAAHDEAL